MQGYRLVQREVARCARRLRPTRYHLLYGKRNGGVQRLLHEREDREIPVKDGLIPGNPGVLKAHPPFFAEKKPQQMYFLCRCTQGSREIDRALLG